ncbi:trehalose operon repressor [Streptococcus caprae]|uniref:Trehalose operon repressor n=1 Tax=Streptococcus caprae TaxID=1640501 RepID=A0ABV8CTJ6_9STRE
MKKYEWIYKDLEQKIQTNQLEPGNFLPTEQEMTQHYQASRDTVRKALQLLTKEGLIHKHQGRGSQVTKREQFNFPVSALTSFQELNQSLGMTAKTNVIALDKLIIDDKLAQLTGFSKNAIVWRVTRQRVMDGIASVLDIDYLLKSLVPDLSRDIAEQSIYAYLENQLNLPIAYAEKEITIDHTSDRDKLLLDLGTDHHIVSIKSKGYLEDGRQFQFTDSRHKLEKFKFVDFARRKRE